MEMARFAGRWKAEAALPALSSRIAATIELQSGRTIQLLGVGCGAWSEDGVVTATATMSLRIGGGTSAVELVRLRAIEGLELDADGGADARPKGVVIAADGSRLQAAIAEKGAYIIGLDGEIATLIFLDRISGLTLENGP